MYKVNATYSLPGWGDVTLDAKDKDEAEDMALQHFEDLYPEAFDLEVTEVEEVDGN